MWDSGKLFRFSLFFVVVFFAVGLPLTKVPFPIDIVLIFFVISPFIGLFIRPFHWIETGRWWWEDEE